MSLVPAALPTTADALPPAVPAVALPPVASNVSICQHDWLPTRRRYWRTWQCRTRSTTQLLLHTWRCWTLCWRSTASAQPRRMPSLKATCGSCRRNLTGAILSFQYWSGGRMGSAWLARGSTSCILCACHMRQPPILTPTLHPPSWACTRIVLALQ